MVCYVFVFYVMCIHFLYTFYDVAFLSDELDMLTYMLHVSLYFLFHSSLQQYKACVIEFQFQVVNSPVH